MSCVAHNTENDETKRKIKHTTDITLNKINIYMQRCPQAVSPDTLIYGQMGFIFLLKTWENVLSTIADRHCKPEPYFYSLSFMTIIQSGRSDLGVSV